MKKQNKKTKDKTQNKQTKATPNKKNNKIDKKEIENPTVPMDLKKEIRRKRSTKMKDIDSTDWFSLKLWRPRMFDTPEELLEFFNLYLSSIQEKETITDKEYTEIYEKPLGKKWKNNNKTELKWVKVDMKLKDVWIFKEKPSKLKFYVFLGGISSETRKNYRLRDDFLEAVELIETYLESVVEDWAISWEINPTIAQFVLNTTYWRVPKSISLEKDYVPTDDEKKKLDDLVWNNA